MFTKKSREEYLFSICSKSRKSAHTANHRNALCVLVVDDETGNIFRWCEWVVMDRLTQRFVERKTTKKNSSLSSISQKTLKTYLMGVYEAAKARVAEELPASFDIVLDGSTFNDRHFIAIFAVFNDPKMWHGDVADDSSKYYSDTDCYTRRFLLLVFCPLNVVEDLGAQSLFYLIADTLSRINKPWETVHFMVVGNCNVNQYIGNNEGALPMVGCASHRFNLAVSDYMTDYDSPLTKIHALMTKLRTIKGRAILRRVTELSPVLHNDTRW
ncbi:hypothetical protein PHMEG_0006514 [Phytophthora megakarya]|uniref:Uncharacterized protein n=1 Tax=Phytophthora megakarya TaxID=4795 RepID=A0A225WNZ7_9STRA|nr:hypothetical protein PHMEG_0006514 [Phytophthora megakarya]